MNVYDPDAFLVRMDRQQEKYSGKTKKLRPLSELDVDNDIPFCERRTKGKQVEKKRIKELTTNKKSVIKKTPTKKEENKNIANYVAKLETHMSRLGYRLETQRALGYWVLKIGDDVPELILNSPSQEPVKEEVEVTIKEKQNEVKDKEEVIHLTDILQSITKHPEQVDLLNTLLLPLGYQAHLTIKLEKLSLNKKYSK